MSSDLIHALEQLEKEKGIEKDIIIEAIEAALISAYKRNFGSSQNVRVSIDRQTGDFKVYALKRVTSNPQNDFMDISIENARKINADLDEEDMAEVEVTPKKFGRIAAQTAKQVVVQRLREAERGIIFDEFSNKEAEIVTGIVQRTEKKNVIIDLGKTEAMLASTEQISGEEYNFNDRIKVYVIEVKRTTKGPQIMVSRTHPGLVKRLFELEVPEIHEGVVEIKSISREPGSRTKIAVYSKDDNVDPVGACVGQKGTRVQAIVDELRGEKIDIIKWSNNPGEYISSSLSPAKVVRVDVNEEEKSAKVTVPDFQLSLAIGKEGQNARLAAKLTGWKIDIKSESQLRNQIESQLFNLDSISYEDDEYEADLDEVTEVSGDTEPEQEYNAEEDLDAAEEKNYDQEADAVEDTDVPDEEISEQETEAEIEPEEKV